MFFDGAEGVYAFVSRVLMVFFMQDGVGIKNRGVGIAVAYLLQMPDRQPVLQVRPSEIAGSFGGVGAETGAQGTSLVFGWCGHCDWYCLIARVVGDWSKRAIGV